MVMTEREILQSYKTAKNQKKQISILADLNSCSPEYIKAILKLPVKGEEIDVEKLMSWAESRMDAINAQISLLEEQYKAYSGLLVQLGELKENAGKKCVNSIRKASKAKEENERWGNWLCQK